MDSCFKLTYIRGYFPLWSSVSNHCKEYIPFILARRICTIVVNKQQELRHLSELKENLKKHDYPVNIITNGIKKALEIPQDELTKLKEKQIYETLSFISTFNSNIYNPPVHNAIKNSVEVLTINNISGFESIKLINSKRQPPNLKELLTKKEFNNEEVGVGK